MIALRLHRPNWLCTVSIGDDERIGRLEYAATEDALRSRLAMEGFTVHEVKPYDFEQEWQRRAGDATAAILRDGKPAAWKRELWTEIKAFLFSLTNGKCGYCEGSVRPVNAGEVEHYRPKGGVSGDPHHDGYYWLAYDIENYVPSCSSCNSGKGKLNQFPIRGSRAYAPHDNLAIEDPELLHPFKMSPSEHIDVVVAETPDKKDLGLIVAKDGSPYGDRSRAVYRLNRGDLLACRRKAISDAAIIYGLLRTGAETAKDRFEAIAAGRDEYSAAKRAKLRTLIDEAEREIHSHRALLQEKEAREQ